jgi:hypothetical protein
MFPVFVDDDGAAKNIGCGSGKAKQETESDGMHGNRKQS